LGTRFVPFVEAKDGIRLADAIVAIVPPRTVDASTDQRDQLGTGRHSNQFLIACWHIHALSGRGVRLSPLEPARQSYWQQSYLFLGKGGSEPDHHDKKHGASESSATRNELPCRDIVRSGKVGDAGRCLPVPVGGSLAALKWSSLFRGKADGNETRATSRLTGWLIPAVVVFALLVTGWFVFAPRDNTVQSVSKPTAPVQTDNTGKRGARRRHSRACRQIHTRAKAMSVPVRIALAAQTVRPTLPSRGEDRAPSGALPFKALTGAVVSAAVAYRQLGESTYGRKDAPIGKLAEVTARARD
jgi:hypothetical protein